ncbi:MAG: hypothetical protein R2854_08195 [Caldilineaceae bacterium]
MGVSVVNILVMLLSFNVVLTVWSQVRPVRCRTGSGGGVLLGGWVLYALIYLGFALARAGWQVWLLFTLYGVYYGTVEGAAQPRGRHRHARVNVARRTASTTLWSA